MRARVCVSCCLILFLNVPSSLTLDLQSLTLDLQSLTSSMLWRRLDKYECLILDLHTLRCF